MSNEKRTKVTTYGVVFPTGPGWDYGEHGANKIFDAARRNGGVPTVTVTTRVTRTHPEWCPVGKPEADEPNMHCGCWSECEPCCRCGDDTPDPECDCERCTAARRPAPSVQSGSDEGKQG